MSAHGANAMRGVRIDRAASSPMRLSVGLTGGHDGDTVRGKECSSSQRSGTRARQHRGFFVPGFLHMAGRATDTTPRKGEEVHRLRSATNLPATRRARVVAIPLGFSISRRSRPMTAHAVISSRFLCPACRRCRAWPGCFSATTRPVSRAPAALQTTCQPSAATLRPRR